MRAESQAMNLSLLVLMSATFVVPSTVDAVQVSNIARDNMPRSKRYACSRSAGEQSPHIFADKSKKTLVCCPKKGDAFETVNEGKEKESGCCFAYDSSAIDSKSQLPCCNNGKRQEKENNVMTCIKRNLEVTVKRQESSQECGKFRNETHHVADFLHQFTHEFLLTMQDKEDQEFKEEKAFCCNTDKLESTSWLFDYYKCCLKSDNFRIRYFIDKHKVRGCNYLTT